MTYYNKKHDVIYKQVWKCKTCDEKVRMATGAWEAWSDEQKQQFIDELERQHLHPEKDVHSKSRA